MRTIKIIQQQGGSNHPSRGPSLDLVEELRHYYELCRRVLEVVEKEHQLLRIPETPDLKPLAALKKGLLPRLSESINRMRQQRQIWQQMDSGQRASYPEVPNLLRQNQDLIMKIIVLDRENEQILLRRGMLPANRLPAAQRQQSHYVTDLYRRGAQVS